MTDKKGTETVVTSYAFDNKDRLTSLVQDGHSIHYQYDRSDNVKKVYYPSEEGDQQKDIDYVYDSYNRLHSILVEGKKTQEYSYTDSGQVEYVKNFRQFDTGGSGYVKVDYGYNSAGLTESIQNLDNGTKKLEEYQMQYDRRGYITKEDLYTNYDVAKTVKKSYHYDEVGRLKTSIQDDKTTGYTYDLVGNRLSMTEGADRYVYSYNQLNQLETKTKNGQADSTYTYDARGNQTKEITKKKMEGVQKEVTSTLTYDLANRLEKVDQTITGEDPVVEKNFYNGDGQRIRRDINGLVSKYFYDGDHLLYTTDINNNKATENVLNPAGAIVASKRFDGAYDNMYFFYQYDIRGSVTSILDPDAKRVKGYGYDEFGETEEVGSQSFLNDVKFTGAVHDSATGLYYMNARHYNPDTGRFISQDTYKGTATNPWSQHLYAYTTNNPINYTDPTGHLPVYIDSDGSTKTALPSQVPSSPNYNPNKVNPIISIKPLMPSTIDKISVARMEMPFGPGKLIKSGVTGFRIIGKQLTSMNKSIKNFIKPKGTGKVTKNIFGMDASKSIKASDLRKYAESHGWKKTQTSNGPEKWVDENGIARITIKGGSDRAPGSAGPHVEIKNSSGQRIDPFGNSVTRKSAGNHTPINF
jgi:RHS repeat-associated protein